MAISGSTTRTTISEAAPLAAPAIGQYRVKLHSWLSRRLRDKDVAEDVVQEFFLRLCRMERTYCIREPLSYLFGIAFHVVREFQGARRRERVVSFNTDEMSRAAEHLQDGADDLHERLHLQRQL